MLRRSIGFFLTIMVTFIAAYQLAWAKDLRQRILENPGQSVGLLTLLLLLGVLLIWAHVKPRPWKVTLAFVLGIIAALRGVDLLEGIGWEQLIVISGCLIVLFFLWAFTVLDRAPEWGWFNRVRTRLTPDPAE